MKKVYDSMGNIDVLIYDVDYPEPIAAFNDADDAILWVRTYLRRWDGKLIVVQKDNGSALMFYATKEYDGSVIVRNEITEVKLVNYAEGVSGS